MNNEIGAAVKKTDERLRDWAEWCHDGKRCSVGLLHKVMKLGPAGAAIKGDFDATTADMPLAVAETDNAIKFLHGEQMKFVYFHYSKPGTLEHKARQARYSLASYKIYLRRIQEIVAAHLGFLAG